MANQTIQGKPTDEQVIRVFVSSTFRDMQAERDELVLKIFPQLRRLCEERGVTWGEIDLRWGITEEQSERGEVLSICLEEIRRCRPYFIGLLGERYGWIPEAIPAEVLEYEPWIKQHADGPDKKSVTELEILHGVLNNPELADHAYFYFRDSGYVETVPRESRKDFSTEDAASTDKLKRLKEDIRQNHQDGKLKCEPRENYPNVKALGERVQADFTVLINSLYPEGQQPSPLDRERMDHEAFARSRAGVYIGRPEYFDRLDAHVAGDGSPLVVLGESGGGKSALLANWALRYREQHPDDLLLLHFVGASPGSANATGIRRRVMLELKQRFNLPDDVPAEPDKIREAFPNWLANAAGEAGCARVSRPRTVAGPNGLRSEGDLRSAESAGSETLAERSSRIVLVLDALNQLEDVDNARDLGWLPLFLAMSNALISRSGLLTFAHDFLRTAARDAYLPGKSQEQAAHWRLAEYFQQQPTWTDRKLDELPWQLAAACQWQQLHDTLTLQPCFLRLFDKNECGLLGHWLQLEPQYDLATLLQATNRLAEAEPLMRRMVEIFLKFTAATGHQHPHLQPALGNYAGLLQAMNLSEATIRQRLNELLAEYGMSLG